MTTLQQLITSAQEQGFKYEAFTSKFYCRKDLNGNPDMWDATDSGTTYFHFYDGKHYYWFKGWFMDDSTEMYFVERYNPNNGYSISSWRRNKEALNKLQINEAI